MRFKYFGVPALLGALALTLCVGARPVQAAPAVEIIYVLDDLTLEIGGIAHAIPNPPTAHMTVRYQAGEVNVRQTTTATGPGPLTRAEIVSGPITVLEFIFEAYVDLGATATAHLTGRLLSPVTGSLVGGSVLSGLSGWALAAEGSVHCQLADTSCTDLFGLIASTPSPVAGTVTGTAQFAGPIGPYGGLMFTRHDPLGTAPVSVVLLPDSLTATGVTMTAREVLRTAVPEAGTLPLLATGVAGLAGLALYVRRRR